MLIYQLSIQSRFLDQVRYLSGASFQKHYKWIFLCQIPNRHLSEYTINFSLD